MQTTGKINSFPLFFPLNFEHGNIRKTLFKVDITYYK